MLNSVRYNEHFHKIKYVKIKEAGYLWNIIKPRQYISVKQWSEKSMLIPTNYSEYLISTSEFEY